jgi:alpha-beta hydrolase superfamily lysophospholipase
MKNETGYFEGRETRKLFYQSWIPDSREIKAYLIAIHGWGTHSDRMKVPAEYFTEKGYAIYSFDLRGHWRSIGDLPGDIDSMDHIQKDIILFMDLVREKANDKKIFLLGHSFGGLVSLIFAITHPGLPGVVVSCPVWDIFTKLSIGKKVIKKVSKTIAKLAPSKVLDNIIDQNQLTSDMKILREHIADKNKLSVITAKSATEIERYGKWTLENAVNLICPVLIMQAGNDKITDKAKTKIFFNKVKSEDKTYKEYPGFLHELWNEKGRAQVYQDMFIWLEKH